MWEIFFGRVQTGRLARLQYLGYSILLNLVLFAIMLGGIMLVGGTERLSGDPAAMQAWFAEHLGIAGMFVIMVIFFVFMFASLNMTAKRLRDMGLPGWLGVLGIFVISLIVSTLFGGGAQPPPGEVATVNPVAMGVQFAILLFLLLVPSDTFGGGRKDAR